MDRKWWTLIAVCIGTFMLLLDVTIVNVALPVDPARPERQLLDLQWVVDAYALTLAALLLTTGSLADLFGRRRMFVIGLVIFTLELAAVGPRATRSCSTWRAARRAWAARRCSRPPGAAGHRFQGRERGTAFGVWGAITGLAVAVGPVVGGALTTRPVAGGGSSWSTCRSGSPRWSMTVLQVEESRQPGARRPDLIGLRHLQRRLAPSSTR